MYRIHEYTAFDLYIAYITSHVTEISVSILERILTFKRQYWTETVFWWSCMLLSQHDEEF